MCFISNVRQYRSRTPLYITTCFHLPSLVYLLALFFFIMSNLDFHFKHPTTIQVSGPTLCGKTRLVLRILEEQIVQPFPTRIIWVFSEWQPDYEQARALYPHIEFVRIWNDEIYESLRVDEKNLLIIDDQMAEAGDSKTLSNLFTKGAHHKNLTVLYLLQNVFNKGKSQRRVSLNTHYNVVFQNERDASQFRSLAYQMHKNNARWLLDAYKHATREPYGYLVLDHHPTSRRDMRVLTNILAGRPLTVYLKRAI